jgi:hypothetical protein
MTYPRLPPWTVAWYWFRVFARPVAHALLMLVMGLMVTAAAPQMSPQAMDAEIRGLRTDVYVLERKLIRIEERQIHAAEVVVEVRQSDLWQTRGIIGTLIAAVGSLLLLLFRRSQGGE